MSSYKLPFGKYKGRSIDYVSGSYLVWLSSVAQGELKQHCVDEIVRRFSVIIKEEELDLMVQIIMATSNGGWLAIIIAEGDGW